MHASWKVNVPVNRHVSVCVCACVSVYTGLIPETIFECLKHTQKEKWRGNYWFIVPSWSRIMDRLTRFKNSLNWTNQSIRRNTVTRVIPYFKGPNRWFNFLGTLCSHWEPSRFCSYFTYARHISFLWVLFESSKTFPFISRSKWRDIYLGSIIV